MLEVEALPKNTKNLSIGEIYFKAKAMEKNGTDIIHLDVGEPDYDSPKKVIEATVSAIQRGCGRYTPPAGIEALRVSISNSLNSKFKINLSPKQVLFTAGGRMALFLAFASVPKDSKVGIICPDWPAYRDLAEFFSFRKKFFHCSLESGWVPDLTEIEQSGCNALIINYPNNPTGKILEPKVFDELLTLANKRKMRIISDEVYSDFVLNEEMRFKSLLDCGVSSHRIFTTSLSKSYAMTGYRAAYLISDETTVARLSQINSMILTSASEFVQYGAIEAIKSRAYVSEKVKLIRSRLSTAVGELRKLGAQFYTPDGSLYIFPRLSSRKNQNFDSARFALELLEKKHVSITPGTAFGPSYREYVRLTLLQSEERIREGIERMYSLLGK